MGNDFDEEKEKNILFMSKSLADGLLYILVLYLADGLLDVFV